MQEFRFSKYISKNSLIHNFSPRTKVLSFIIIISVIFFPYSYHLATAVFISSITLLFVAKLSPKVIWQTFKPVLFVSTFVFLVNMLIIDDKVYAAILSSTYTLKIWSVLIFGSILTMTTKESDIANSFSWLLSPFKIFKLPVEEISLILTLGIRFIPTIFSDFKSILIAEASRGIDIKSWNIKMKFIAIKNAMIPLLVHSFKRADEVGNALMIKEYNPKIKRSSYLEYKIHWYDWMAPLWASSLATALIVLPIYFQVLAL